MSAVEATIHQSTPTVNGRLEVPKLPVNRGRYGLVTQGRLKRIAAIYSVLFLSLIHISEPTRPY